MIQNFDLHMHTLNWYVTMLKASAVNTGSRDNLS